MKTTKKILSMILSVLMIFSTVTPAFAAPSSNKVTAAFRNLLFEIDTDKTSYSWGDTITFVIKATNISDEIVEYVGVDADASIPDLFADTRQHMGVIETVVPGGHETVLDSFSTSELSLLTRLLFPLKLIYYRFFNRSSGSYSNMATKRVKVGLLSYDFYINAESIDTLTDTDGEGLVDYLERKFNTDPRSGDTDGDGLSDWVELNTLALDPTKRDTDGNEIDDGFEDNDEDKLVNLFEIRDFCTNPSFFDSDNDFLSDYDEIKTYLTDPNNKDTDFDGVDDGTEISLGTDPLKAEDTFVSDAVCGAVNEDNPVSASAKVRGDADTADSLKIEEVTVADDIRLGSTIPGYLGSAFDFSVDGQMTSAEITFSYDKSLGKIGKNFQPRIYYFNEEEGSFTELEDQKVENGVVTAEVSHFSTYILLNKVAVDAVWDMEISPEDRNSENYLGIDVVFTIDSSGSMSDNDPSGIRKLVAKNFASKLTEKDRAAVVDFDSSAYVYQEFTSDYSLVESAINRVNSSGGTSLTEGISASLKLFMNDNSERTDVKKYIIFLTDGNGSYNSSYTSLANEHDIVIYTIGLGYGVKESVLREIAEGTGGSYYFASAADDLTDIYDDIETDTRNSIDTNKDGISDYYTQLIMDGLVINGENLFGFDLNVDSNGNPSDDWDGDGLKNGEEVSVKSKNGRPYLVVKSSPIFADTDGDGYNDGEEVKTMNTSPLKYTKAGASGLRSLTAINNFNYPEYAHETVEFEWVFDWNRPEEAKAAMINYYYDYASVDTISKNADRIAVLEKYEMLQSNMESLLKFTKSTTGLINAATKWKSWKSSVTMMTNKANGVVNDVHSKTKSAVNLLNKKKTDEALKEIENACKRVKAEEKTIKSLVEMVLEFEPTEGIMEVSDAQELTEYIESFVNDFGSVTGFMSGCFTIASTFQKRIKAGKTLTSVSNKYQSYLGRNILPVGKNGNITVGTALDIIIDVAEFGVESFEICNTYARVAANVEALENYIDVIDYVARNGNDKDYVKIAAYEIEKILLDKSWGELYKQMAEAVNQQGAKTAVKVLLDVGGSLNKYVKIAQLVIEGLELYFNFLGYTEYAQTRVKICAYDAIADGTVHYAKEKTSINGDYVDFDDGATSYVTQLAQIHIVGEREYFEYYRGNNVLAWFTGQASSEDWNKWERNSIGRIYGYADALDAVVSSNLPFYSDFHDESGELISYSPEVNNHTYA